MTILICVVLGAASYFLGWWIGYRNGRTDERQGRGR